MKESIFGRAYKYRESKDKGNLENFLTELFAGALEIDKEFRKRFFKSIGIIPKDDIVVYTQKSYPLYGRPDIEILNGEDEIILIESKVEASERENQLSDYLKILGRKKVKSKILVYLTKYYEGKDVQKEGIEFKEVTWFEVSELIDDECSIFSIELQNFLTDYKIAMDSNFTNLDLVVLENIAGTISKMDEVIDSVKDIFAKRFGKLSRESSRSTRLKWGAYYNYKHIGRFNIDIGYMWWDWGDIYLGIRLWIPTSDKDPKTELIKHLAENLTDWEFEEHDDCVTIGNYKKASEFLIEDDEDVPAMTKFLKESINELHEVKKLNLEMFK